ncbi:universal stress protein [Streptomyces sp. NPDC060048]|uniref:universal stress protein n=1 Tax=unclassified Streptomyces TaxID=2593676 RepID=UPI00367C8E94
MSLPLAQPSPPSEQAPPSGAEPSLPFLVGFDGSYRSLAAARWAAREASSAGAPLHLLHVGQAWPRIQPISPEFVPVLGESELAIVAVLASLAAELRSAHPGLTVETATAEGGPGNELPRAAARSKARLLVLGASGHTHHVVPVLGSTALHVAGRADLPVVLIREPAAERAQRGGGVVVGVDPAGDHASVLDFAFAWASTHGLALRAVHAAGAGASAEQLEAVVAAASARRPGVPTEWVSRPGEAARVLVDESAAADLLVVGRRRHRPLHGLGPTDHAVAHNVHAPVALIPHG